MSSSDSPGIAATLRRRVTRGVAWSMLAMLLSRLIQTITVLILARLLAPADFGLMAIAIIVMSALSLFRDMGLNQALIHQREQLGLAADTAFYMTPLLGLALTGLTALSAPAIAGIFGNQEATSIIRVMSVCLFISSFGLVPAAMLERDLHFRRKFIPDSLPVIGYCVAALIAAANGLGVWSLVIGELFRSLLTATAIWFFSPWRPGLCFDFAIARQLLSYGRHIVGAGIAIFIFTNADNAAIARWLGVEQLGLYVFAFTLGAQPLTQISYSVSRVIFPAYSSIQRDFNALVIAFRRTVASINILVAPLALITVTVGPSFLFLLYGEKWEGSATALQILAFYGFFRVGAGAAGEVLKSLGKPRLLALVTYAQLILVLAALYPAVTRGEIAGVAILFTGTVLAGTLVSALLACQACGARPLEIYFLMFKSLLFAAISAFVARAIAGAVATTYSWPGLILTAVLLIAFYTLLTLVFSRSTVRDIFSLFRRSS